MNLYAMYGTSEEDVGNDCRRFEIEAPDLETAYELANEQFPDIAIDRIELLSMSVKGGTIVAFVQPL